MQRSAAIVICNGFISGVTYLQWVKPVWLFSSRASGVGSGDVVARLEYVGRRVLAGIWLAVRLEKQTPFGAFPVARAKEAREGAGPIPAGQEQRLSDGSPVVPGRSGVVRLRPLSNPSRRSTVGKNSACRRRRVALAARRARRDVCFGCKRLARGGRRLEDQLAARAGDGAQVVFRSLTGRCAPLDSYSCCCLFQFGIQVSGISSESMSWRDLNFHCRSVGSQITDIVFVFD